MTTMADAIVSAGIASQDEIAAAAQREQEFNDARARRLLKFGVIGTAADNLEAHRELAKLEPLIGFDLHAEATELVIDYVESLTSKAAGHTYHTSDKDASAYWNIRLAQQLAACRFYGISQDRSAYIVKARGLA